MTTPAEDAIYAGLTDITELEQIAVIGLPLEILPTKQMHAVVKWSLDYYYESGRRQAPTREHLLDNWGDALEEGDVTLVSEDEERDTISSAIQSLKGRFADSEFQTFIKAAATEMASAPITEKVPTLTQVTNLLFGITSGLQDRSNTIEGYAGITGSLDSYLARAAAERTMYGMGTGWPQIDEHMGGIRDGELCVVGAGPKVGKSYLLCLWALREWLRGRRTVLYTLENSVEMTYDRIVCIASGVSSREYQRGKLSEEALARVVKFIEEHGERLRQTLRVISPPRGARTPEMIVRDALNYGSESVLVDQLTHVEHPDPGRKPRHEIFNENVHEFKYLISTGQEKIPLVLAHQINREGVKAAEKIGHLEMHHLAESAGIERAADWVLGLYQSQMDREARMTLLQIMASRREDTQAWSLYWDLPESGASKVRNVVKFE